MIYANKQFRKNNKYIKLMCQIVGKNHESENGYMGGLTTSLFI